MDPNDKLLAGQMGDTASLAVEPEASDDFGPDPQQLEHMLTQMRRMHRKNRADDEREIAESKTTREADEVRFRMLWTDWLYRKDIDRISGRSNSSKTRAAERAVKDHVDMMNKVYGLEVPHPKPLEIGDPIPVGAKPIHEYERVRVDPLPGQSIELRPEEEGL